jgi:FMN phosphatase YigB (HAD superfamily)
MIRAVLFDFYGVWLPDIFSTYMGEAQQHGPEAVAELEQAINQYFHGMIDVQEIAGKFRFKLSRLDIEASQFVLDERSISPAIVDFMRELHGHFVKLGVLANMGTQELRILNSFNERNQVFEVIAGPLAFHSDKPLLSQEVFAQALQTIGEPPKNCLVVTGNPVYQSFATGIGMTVLPFQGFPALRQELDRLLSSEMS